MRLNYIQDNTGEHIVNLEFKLPYFGAELPTRGTECFLKRILSGLVNVQRKIFTVRYSSWGESQTADGEIGMWLNVGLHEGAHALTVWSLRGGGWTCE